MAHGLRAFSQPALRQRVAAEQESKASVSTRFSTSAAAASALAGQRANLVSVYTSSIRSRSRQFEEAAFSLDRAVRTSSGPSGRDAARARRLVPAEQLPDLIPGSPSTGGSIHGGPRHPRDLSEKQ